jgi:hypothetical protein
VFPEIVVESFAARAFEQSMKMHVGSISFRKPRAVCFTQSAHAGFAALVANFAASVAAAMIEAHPGASSSSSHWLSPSFSTRRQLSQYEGQYVQTDLIPRNLIHKKSISEIQQ